MAHVVKTYDITKYNFDNYVKDCYSVVDLAKLHLIHPELSKSKLLTQENDAETPFHKKF